MKLKLASFWDSVRSSYWFVPASMVIGAILLSVITLFIDSIVKSTRASQSEWIYAGGSDGARTLLTMLAASMLTIFGVVFSIVIVALTLASSQFGPRLVRTFLSDTVDQSAVGMFLGTFVYCLLISRTVGGEGATAFVPHVSVSVAILLALVSLGVLIYFINHMSLSLQASYIIAAVGEDLRRTIESEIPELHRDAIQSPAEQILNAFRSASVVIRAGSGGYIQAIDYDRLVSLAQSKDLLVRLTVCAGDFLVRGDEIAVVSAATDRSGELAEAVNSALIVGVDRTHEQDVEFPINQLVQLAVRALSPAINDPITAIIAIEHLRAGLCYIAERGSPSIVIWDENKVQRLLVKRQDGAHNVEAAFSLIRQYGRGNLEVNLALLDAIEQIARRTADEQFRSALLQQATLVENGAQAAIPEQADRQRVAERFQRVAAALSNG